MSKMTAEKKLKDLMNWAKSELSQEKNHKVSKCQSAFRDDKIKFLNRLIEAEELFQADRDTHARQMAVEFMFRNDPNGHEHNNKLKESIGDLYDTFTASTDRKEDKG